MSDKFYLAQKFVETYPKAAARVLEELDAQPASTYIDAVPDRESTQLIGSMLPFYAAKCIAALKPDVAAKYVGPLEPRAAANILRYVSAEIRTAIMNALPRRQQARVSIVMNYPVSTVGAWIDTTVLSLPADRSIGDVRKRLQSEQYADFNRIYVVGDDQNLLGAIRLSVLFNEGDNATLSALLEPAPDAIRANLSVDRAYESPAWETVDYLPVIDRHSRFLGVLRFADLRAARTESKPAATEGDLSGGLMDVAESCYLELADFMIVALSPTRSDAENKR